MGPTDERSLLGVLRTDDAQALAVDSPRWLEATNDPTAICASHMLGPIIVMGKRPHCTTCMGLKKKKEKGKKKTPPRRATLRMVPSHNGRVLSCRPAALMTSSCLVMRSMDTSTSPLRSMSIDNLGGLQANHHASSITGGMRTSPPSMRRWRTRISPRRFGGQPANRRSSATAVGIVPLQNRFPNRANAWL